MFILLQIGYTISVGRDMEMTFTKNDIEMVVGVIEPGYLTIPVRRSEDGHGNDDSGRYATYRCRTPERLVTLANQHCWVERRGKTIRGAAYTLRMAKNDFARYGCLAYYAKETNR
jgi:hypothetical protein